MIFFDIEFYDISVFVHVAAVVVGSTMGTRDELAQLARLCETSGIRPQIDRELPLSDAREGFAAMASGDVFGKIVFAP